MFNTKLAELNFENGSIGYLFENMPNAFQSAFQQNMLDTRFQSELAARSKLRQVAAKIPIPLRTGEQRIYTRAGDLVPVIAADNPVNNTLSYDLGINAPGVGSTNNSYPIEQWNIVIAERSQSLDINIIQDEETLASFYRKNWDKLAKQAALSLDLISMQQVAVSYESGQTWVTASTTAGTTVTTLAVDNVFGLNTAFATTTFNGTTFPYGSPNPVSTTNTLAVTLYKAAGGTINGVVWGSVTDSSNTSTMTTPAGIVAGNSGELTITFAGAVSYAPQVGDVIVAADAPVVLRPNNRYSRYQLQTSDTLGMQLFINAKAVLENNGVEPFADGTYACYLDAAMESQVFTDPQFQIMAMGAVASDIFVNAKVSHEFGLTFIKTTNVPIYTGWSGSGSAPATKSRRAYIIGQECLQEGTFEGMATGYRAMADQDLGYIRVLEPDSMFPYALITRPALDRKAQIWSQTWVWVGGVACGTDATITNAVVPTANASRFKRAATIEVAG